LPSVAASSGAIHPEGVYSLQEMDREQSLKEVFHQFDLDVSGSIEPQELLRLGRMRRQLGQKEGQWTYAHNRRLIARMDRNKDGLISEQEFVRHFDEEFKGLSQDEFATLMAQFSEVASQTTVFQTPSPSPVSSPSATPTVPRSTGRSVGGSPSSALKRSPSRERMLKMQQRLDELGTKLIETTERVRVSRQESSMSFMGLPVRVKRLTEVFNSLTEGDDTGKLSEEKVAQVKQVWLDLFKDKRTKLWLENRGSRLDELRANDGSLSEDSFVKFFSDDEGAGLAYTRESFSKAMEALLTVGNGQNSSPGSSPSQIPSPSKVTRGPSATFDKTIRAADSAPEVGQATDSAWEKFERQRDPMWEKYEEQRDPMWEKFEEKSQANKPPQAPAHAKNPSKSHATTTGNSRVAGGSSRGSSRQNSPRQNSPRQSPRQRPGEGGQVLALDDHWSTALRSFAFLAVAGAGAVILWRAHQRRNNA